MKQFQKIALGLILSVGLAVFPVMPTPAIEQVDFSQENWYVGGGINHNSLDNFDDAFGIQGLAGLDLPYKPHRQITTHAEIGVISTDDFEGGNSGQTTNHTGLWTAGLAKIHINQSFRGLGRIGFDFGDDDGPLFGVGGEVDLTPKQWFLRGEFVARDDITSLQMDLVYHF